MPIAQGMLNEFEHEAAQTRRCFERVPEDKFDYKPHEKCFNMQELVSHTANIAEWGNDTLTGTEFNVDMETYKPWLAASRAELLEKWDAWVADFKEGLAKASDEQMMENWTLKMSGNPVFSMPRVAVLRSMIFNHMVHHRAQLCMYFRLLDIPVPALYGPSADEEPQNC